MTIIPIEGHPMPMPIPEGTIYNNGDEYLMFLNDAWHPVEYVENTWLIVDIPEKKDDNTISSYL